MLHILWMILKVILITLGILLGLILLILLLILFCPIRYRAMISSHDNLTEGKAGISWLFHFISANAVYRGGQKSIQIKVLGIPLERYRGISEKFRRRKQSADAESAKHRMEENAEDIRPKRSDLENEQKKHTVSEKNVISEEKIVSERSSASEEPVNQQKSFVSKENPDFPEKSEGEGQAESRAGFAGLGARIQRLWRLLCGGCKKIFRILCNLFRSIGRIPVRIFGFFRKIALTIRRFCVKINKWKLFWEDERTRAGLSLGWREFLRLLKHAGPRRIKGNLTIGLENPAATGQVLALIGATCPIHKNAVTVTPVFDRAILEADVQARGRIYLIIVFITGLKLYLDKNIKFMLKEINKEG